MNNKCFPVSPDNRYKSYCFGVFIVLVRVDDLVGITGFDVVEYDTPGCALLPLHVFGVPLVGLVGVLLLVGEVGDVAVVVKLVVKVVLVAVVVLTVGLVVLETQGFGGSVTDCTFPSVSVTGSCQERFIC